MAGDGGGLKQRRFAAGFPFPEVHGGGTLREQADSPTDQASIAPCRFYVSALFSLHASSYPLHPHPIPLFQTPKINPLPSLEEKHIVRNLFQTIIMS